MNSATCVSTPSLLISTLLLKEPMEQNYLFRFIAAVVARLKKAGKNVGPFLSFSGPYAGELQSVGLSSELNFYISNGLVYWNKHGIIGLTDRGNELLDLNRINRDLDQKTKKLLLSTIENTEVPL